MPWREGRFLLRLLTAGGREQARPLLDPAFPLPAEDTLGRSLDFAFGAGDRGSGLYAPETQKRLARVKEDYDPANLFRRNCGVSAAC
ncbi:BBE domain-containing protein [Streptomyces monashensis]